MSQSYWDWLLIEYQSWVLHKGSEAKTEIISTWLTFENKEPDHRSLHMVTVAMKLKAAYSFEEKLWQT